MLADGVDVRLVVPSGPPLQTTSQTTSQTPVTPAPPAASRLPRTGADVVLLLVLVVVLVATGAALLRAGRRHQAPEV